MIDLKFLRGLISALDESSIDTLELSRGGTRIRLSKTPAPAAVTAAPALHTHHVSVPAAPAAEPAPAVAMPEAAAAPLVPAPVAAVNHWVEVKSPMVGTFYRSPSPEAPAYVELGGRVARGQTLCILEAMKLMNELESELSGIVREICVENSQPVEYGQVLFRIASDLHLKVGRPPVLRVDGDLVETALPPLRPDDLRRCAEQITNPRQRELFAEQKELDFAVGVQGLGRFRVNLFQQRGTYGFAFRLVPFEIPGVAELMLPPAVESIALAPRGLVLVTGITGSGKSTTLASMLALINERRPVNILTVEDPIEFLHRDARAVISQREVGVDTLSFHEALRHVLRQDPDVIMLGEIRDRESMETVLKAADTGHLVLSTLHTTDAAQTIGRVISFFAPHQHQEIRDLLASVLRAVISLRLIARDDGPGRVPAAEVLVNTAAIGSTSSRTSSPRAGCNTACRLSTRA